MGRRLLYTYSIHWNEGGRRLMRWSGYTRRQAEADARETAQEHGVPAEVRRTSMASELVTVIGPSQRERRQP